MTQNKYRSTVILDTRGREESVDALIEGLKKEVSAVNGTVLTATSEGSRPFARVTDRNLSASTYVTMELQGPLSLPAALKERVRLNKVVHRLFIQRAQAA